MIIKNRPYVHSKNKIYKQTKPKMNVFLVFVYFVISILLTSSIYFMLQYQEVNYSLRNQVNLKQREIEKLQTHTQQQKANIGLLSSPDRTIAIAKELGMERILPHHIEDKKENTN